MRLTVNSTKVLDRFSEEQFKRSEAISKSEEDGGRHAARMDFLPREVELQILFLILEGTKEELVAEHVSLADMIVHRGNRMEQLLERRADVPVITEVL